jgi:hypothetical protein
MGTGLDGASTSQPNASAACTQELARGNEPPELAPSITVQGEIAKAH